jgi:hypothetical protein
MPRKLANIAANMRANFFCAVRRCQARYTLSGDVRRCQARYTLSGDVRRCQARYTLSGDVRRCQARCALSGDVRRCQARYALSGALCAVRRCQALSGVLCAVRHKKTAHDSAAHIGNKKAALGGLIGFYKVKCNVTKTANPASFMMRSIVSAFMRSRFASAAKACFPQNQAQIYHCPRRGLLLPSQLHP